MTPPKWTREATECRQGGKGGFVGVVGEAPEWAIPERVPLKTEDPEGMMRNASFRVAKSPWYLLSAG